MASALPALRRALVLDPDIYSGEGLRLLCEELGFVAEVVRLPRLLPPTTGANGTIALAIVDARIAEDGDAIALIAKRVDALTHRTAPIVVLGGDRHWAHCFAHRPSAVIAKPIAPGRLIEVVLALQSRT